MFPDRVPIDRDTQSPEPLVYLFMYVCRSPQKGALLQNEENTKSPFRSTTQTEGLHTMGVRPGSPGGSLTTLLSLPQCQAAFSTIPSTMAWVYRSPVSQRVS